jgi:hypothetical protein
MFVGEVLMVKQPAGSFPQSTSLSRLRPAATVSMLSMGQWRRRAQTRFPRYLPRRRLLPSHVELVKGICLHEHKIDHIAHLGPAAAAGIGTALNLPVETIYQAVQQALHVTITTRQSRKGEISSWKAYAPAFAGKMAVEAVDRVMQGEGAPSPGLGRRRQLHRLPTRPRRISAAGPRRRRS